MTPLEWGLLYAEHGIPVAPVRKGALKHHLAGSKGYNDATTDPEQIRAWCDAHEVTGWQANLKDTIWRCIDVDDHGKDGRAHFEALLAQQNLTMDWLEWVPQQQTPRGNGRHYWIKSDLPRAVGFITGCDFTEIPHLAPSPDYEWEYLPWEGDIIRCPAWLAAAVTAKHTKQQSASAAGYEFTADENRNQQLMEFCVGLMKQDTGWDDYLRLSLLFNSRFAPPLDDKEAMQVIKSCLRYGPKGTPPPLDDEQQQYIPMTVAAWAAAAGNDPVPERVYGPLTTGQTSIWYGDEKTGKTLLTGALAYSIAAGQDVLHYGEMVQARKVLWIDCEMSRRRLFDRYVSQGFSLVNNLLMDCQKSREEAAQPAFELGNPSHTEWLFWMIDRQGVDVIFLDNVMACMVLDEQGNHGLDMWRSAVKQLETGIRDRNACLVMLDHANQQGQLNGSVQKRRSIDMRVRIEGEVSAGATIINVFPEVNRDEWGEFGEAVSWKLRDGKWLRAGTPKGKKDKFSDEVKARAIELIGNGTSYDKTMALLCDEFELSKPPSKGAIFNWVHNK
jgi:hypothetical protein